MLGGILNTLSRVSFDQILIYSQLLYYFVKEFSILYSFKTKYFLASIFIYNPLTTMVTEMFQK